MSATALEDLLEEIVEAEDEVEIREVGEHPDSGGGSDGDEAAEGPPAPAGTGEGAVGSVPRSAAGTSTPATLTPVTVEIRFQVYPGKTTSSGTNIGIPNVPYQLTVGSGPTATSISSTTNADGRVTISLIPGSVATLRIFDTDFRVRIRDTLEPVTALAGLQRRLQMLGHYLGPDGADGLRGTNTEKAILDFQADDGLRIDGVSGSQTRTRLTHADWVGE